MRRKYARYKLFFWITNGAYFFSRFIEVRIICPDYRVLFCHSFLHFVTHFLMSGLYVCFLSLFELKIIVFLKDEIKSKRILVDRMHSSLIIECIIKQYLFIWRKIKTLHFILYILRVFHSLLEVPSATDTTQLFQRSGLARFSICIKSAFTMVVELGSKSSNPLPW